MLLPMLHPPNGWGVIKLSFQNGETKGRPPVLADNSRWVSITALNTGSDLVMSHCNSSRLPPKKNQGRFRLNWASPASTPCANQGIIFSSGFSACNSFCNQLIKSPNG